MPVQVTVIGTGVSGIAATLEAQAQGAEVTLIGGRPGASALNSGAWDIALAPSLPPTPLWQEIPSPRQGFQEIVRYSPQHPYALIAGNSPDPLALLANALERLSNQLSFHLRGSTEQSFLALSPLGTVKPTAYTDVAHSAGNLLQMRGARLLITGWKGSASSAPLIHKLLGEEHQRQNFPYLAELRSTELALKGLRISSTIDLAKSFDDEATSERLIDLLIGEAARHRATHVALPPIMGIERTSHIFSRLAESTDQHWFEILGFPPSVPGLRLYRHIQDFVKNSRLRFLSGEVSSIKKKNRQITQLLVNGEEVPVERLVLCTGKFISSGLLPKKNDPKSLLEEPLLGWPVLVPGEMTQGSFFEAQGFASAGIRASTHLQPVDLNGKLLYENLWAAGSLLGGYDAALQGCGMGVAVGTGTLAGRLATLS